MDSLVQGRQLGSKLSFHFSRVLQRLQNMYTALHHFIHETLSPRSPLSPPLLQMPVVFSLYVLGLLGSC